MGWVKKGDRWQVTGRNADGSLTVRRLGKGDRPHCRALTLPAGCVAEDVELGYSTTAHRAQGSTVDTAHALIDPDSASRELFYVVQPDPHELEPHLDPPEERTRTEQLARVLARSDADLSATETLKAELDRHASRKTLMDEYYVLAREADHDHWEALLDVAPFTPEVSEAVFTSPRYEHLEATLSRHEADGHDVTRILTALAPTITAGEDRDDPAAQLATAIDQATRQLPRRRNTRPRVAGLITTPAGNLGADMQAALTACQELIEAGALRLLRHALDAEADWTKQLGAVPTASRQRTAWIENAATIALYRHRHDIDDPAPLGDPHQISGPEHGAEYRRANASLRRLHSIENRGQSTPPTNRRTRGPRL